MTSASQVRTSESALPTSVNAAFTATNLPPTSASDQVVAKSPKSVLPAPKSIVLYLRSPKQDAPSPLNSQRIFDLLQEQDHSYSSEVIALQQRFVRQAPDVDIQPYGARFLRHGTSYPRYRFSYSPNYVAGRPSSIKHCYAAPATSEGNARN